MLEALLAPGGTIPESFWSVSASDNDQVVLRGAVLIRIGAGEAASAKTTNRDLAAAVREPPVRPLARVLAMLGPATRRALPLTAAAALILGVTSVAQGLLFRSMFDFVAEVGLPQERLVMLGAFAALAAILVTLDYAVTRRAVAWGHELQGRFAAVLFEKLASLRSDYFGSRLVSDMAERSHAIAELRSLPFLLSRALRSASTFVITSIALFYLMPQSRLTLVIGALSLLGIAFLFEPLFAETDLRARTHSGGLTRFYLDALAGLGAIHAHSAERVVRREHESLMTDWMRAMRRQITAAVSQTTILALTGFALAAVLIRRYLASVDDPGGVLLIAYWALNLPAVAAEIAQAMQTWASMRSVILRILEPLDAPPEETSSPSREPATAGGVAIEFRGAVFAAAGHEILSGIDLDIPAGARIGIVGSSGAGKSTLVGSLLGWMQASAGEIRVDGELLTPARIASLRRETAWVDPAIQLFNVPMEENVRYSSGSDDVARLPFALSEAELYEVLERIPDSQMPLGEGGGMLSGGEGQRVRLARALMQSGPRLVILDEAFRGMDRTMRGELLRRCRRLWSETTFLFVTHDVDETVDCDRVVVMQGGRVIEYDTPAVLIAHAESLYNRMRESNRAIREEVWGSAVWRPIELRNGRIAEDVRA
ncbi:MAG: hypothetical protein QOK37_4789 [Thermoanaerobaculia bacterium]|jgi:ATP-binding cassette subfamily B protein|nr:hypothetical protein [Thermoanaerobaculia bacterium]